MAQPGLSKDNHYFPLLYLPAPPPCTFWSSGRTQCSHAGTDGAVSLYLGKVALERFDDFCTLADKLLAKAMARRGNKRSAAENDQGNQKTPALIQAVLSDALEKLDAKEEPEESSAPPRGGFTDVGLHTGGCARNTGWPLVQAVMQVLLEEQDRGHRLHRLTVALLRLWIAERQLAVLRPETATSERVDVCMQMMAAAATAGAELADDGLDMALFEARCITIRFVYLITVRWPISPQQHALKAETNPPTSCARSADIRDITDERAFAHAEKFALPPVNNADIHCRNPKLTLPKPTMPAFGADSLDAARKRAADNLGWLPEPLKQGATWTEAEAWLQLPKLQAASVEASTLLLANVHRLACASAEALASSGSTSEDVAAIERVVDTYRRVMRKLQTMQKALLCAELRSQELLVTWVAFCVIHKATAHAHPQLLKYGVPLDADCLRHLVLSQKPAVDAALCVAAYLRAHATASPVFSLLDKDTTFELAREFARGSHDMCAAWKLEQAQAQERREQHWNAVTAKLRLLQRLDAELRSLERQRDSAARSFSATKRPSKHTTHEEDRRRDELKTKLDLTVSSILSKKSEIETAEKPPSAIFQPLPADESSAMPIIFFVMMPPHFQLLSRMSFTAQQLLLPEASSIKLPDGQEIDITSAIKNNAPATAWRDYYQSLSTGRAKIAVTTKIVLGSFSKVPSEWGPKNVREFTSSGDGVWHPDSLTPALYWNGGSFDLDARGGYFNPFSGSVAASVVVHHFTELLPAEYSKLQWAMPQYGADTSRSRGNEPLASQDIKPEWLSKPAFLAFGALRAYPRQQVSIKPYSLTPQYGTSGTTTFTPLSTP